ncbi:hypothetical protein QNI19_06055 [Cytophagaceae bacterium DM2B3-1]|uniref:DUF4294 domain-containing protein n=1 Tax=Xanthocytophaga flava TaxID=3048013 RepID=A0ABT7CHL6_9BACT|nr:hypothetical protein [Xanthocytophaga flavus]MDJ1492485.1 hypothetical protein [Xanthocytophaga flavus]
MINKLPFLVVFCISMTGNILAQKISSGQDVIQYKTGCIMTNKLFLQMITYVGSDLVMAVPKTFRSVKINKNTYGSSQVLESILESDSLFMADSTLSFQMRFGEITYRDKRRQQLFKNFELEVWSFKKQVDAYNFFVALGKGRKWLMVNALRYILMGKTIFILTSQQASNYPTINGFLRLIEREYTCFGKTEYDYVGRKQKS